MNYYDAMQIRLRHAQLLPVSHAALTEANSYIERERKLQREKRLHAPPPVEAPPPPASLPPEPAALESEDPTFGTPLMCVGWAVVAEACAEAVRIATEARAVIPLALTPIVALDFYRSAV